MKALLIRYKRFLKFAVVGASGVVVNLGIYALLTQVFGMGGAPGTRSAAYAVSVEISIITNFLLNDVWTFRDRVGGAPSFLSRGVRFHLVSLIGFLINWGTFTALNLALPDTADQPIPLLGELLSPFIVSWDYVYAMLGITLAIAWNYLGNLKWTWTTSAWTSGA